MRLQDALATALLAISGASPAWAGRCNVGGSCVTVTDEAACLALGGTYLGAGECPANGYVPETTPREGEQRLNRFQFIGSHNAFQRGVSLSDQISDWGHVFLELDIWYHESSDTFEVQHNCCDTIGEGTLGPDLSDASVGHALQQGLLVIDFELHVDATGECSYCFDVFPSDWKDRIWNQIVASFPEETIYTSGEFQDVDASRWPSVQELFRRGRHVIVMGSRVSDWGEVRFFDYAGDGSDDGANEVHFASGDNTDSWDLEDQYTSEWYPSGGTCVTETTNQWQTAVASGFTFPTTYCVDDTARILDSRIHPPFFLYVNGSTAESEQLGTWGRPYGGTNGLLSAVVRVKAHENAKGASNVTIVLESGHAHQAFGSLAAAPPFMTITTRGGPVTLTN